MTFATPAVDSFGEFVTLASIANVFANVYAVTFTEAVSRWRHLSLLHFYLSFEVITTLAAITAIINRNNYLTTMIILYGSNVIRLNKSWLLNTQNSPSSVRTVNYEVYVIWIYVTHSLKPLTSVNNNSQHWVRLGLSGNQNALKWVCECEHWHRLYSAVG